MQIAGFIFPYKQYSQWTIYPLNYFFIMIIRKVDTLKYAAHISNQFKKASDYC